jgi:guanine deaminase
MQSTFMKNAIQLAFEGMRLSQGGPFGAVIVKDNQIVGRGYNNVLGSQDPTAHAEITAIRDACKKLNTFSLAGCEIYTNCEPCPMCLGAIYWARLEKIYFGVNRQDAAHIGFDDNLFYEEIAKPLSQRKIPLFELLKIESFAPFQAWKEDMQKVTY